jgi:GTPase SAR1 family protein
VQEAYADLKREKMGTGDGYLLVYSITDDTTFAKVDRLREEILRAQGGRMVPIFLVGTKADLASDRAVSEKERLAKARAWNCQSFEVSAKTGRQGVKDVFEGMANAIVQIDSYKGMGGGGSVMGAGLARVNFAARKTPLHSVDRRTHGRSAMGSCV